MRHLMAWWLVALAHHYLPWFWKFSIRRAFWASGLFCKWREDFSALSRQGRSSARGPINRCARNFLFHLSSAAFQAFLLAGISLLELPASSALFSIWFCFFRQSFRFETFVFSFIFSTYHFHIFNKAFCWYFQMNDLYNTGISVSRRHFSAARWFDFYLIESLPLLARLFCSGIRYATGLLCDKRVTALWETKVLIAILAADDSLPFTRISSQAVGHHG